MDSREQKIVEILRRPSRMKVGQDMGGSVEMADVRMTESHANEVAFEILALFPQSKPQMRVSELVAEMRRDARAFEDTDPDNERTVIRHRAKAEILKQWADKIASLDLQPDPPTEAMLTDEEIEAVVRAAFNADALLQHYVESRGHWERLTPIVAQAAAKKAFAAGKNEVLKEPGAFGLVKLADDQIPPSGVRVHPDYLDIRDAYIEAGFRKVVIQKVQK